jgi:hypothetical protein
MKVLIALSLRKFVMSVALNSTSAPSRWRRFSARLRLPRPSPQDRPQRAHQPRRRRRCGAPGGCTPCAPRARPPRRARSRRSSSLSKSSRLSVPKSTVTWRCAKATPTSVPRHPRRRPPRALVVKKRMPAAVGRRRGHRSGDPLALDGHRRGTPPARAAWAGSALHRAHRGGLGVRPSKASGSPSGSTPSKRCTRTCPATSARSSSSSDHAPVVGDPSPLSREADVPSW